MADPSSPVLKMLFRISDPEHPHYPETGRLTGEVVSLFGKSLAKLKIDACRHGTDACFVSPGQITQIAEAGSVKKTRRPRG